MNKEENLLKKFEKAGLRLRFENINRNSDIFGMRVSGGMHKEVFEMQPGHETNTIEVLDSDKDAKQILLMVKEEEREFTTTEWDTKQQTHVEVKRKTDPSKRKFLIGMDERSYFMAPVADNSINIRDAKEKLRNPNLKRSDSITRQGEWFFVRAHEQDFINEEVESGRAIKYSKVGIGAVIGNRGGKPHVGDEVVRIRTERFPQEDLKPSLERLYRGIRSGRDLSLPGDMVFVRGKVRHPDHKTVEFSAWHRVYRNTEDRESATTGTWID